MAKKIVFFSKEGKSAISGYTADGLVVCGDGHGDPTHSGLDEFMHSEGDCVYEGDATTPYKHAIYVCNDFSQTWKAVAKLCEMGCRSVVVCIGGVVPPKVDDVVIGGLEEHSECGWKLLIG